MPNKLFQNVATLARQQALPGLKARAIEGGFISVVCMDCYAFIEDKPSAGVSGLSHGLCDQCFAERKAEMA